MRQNEKRSMNFSGQIIIQSEDKRSMLLSEQIILQSDN